MINIKKLFTISVSAALSLTLLLSGCSSGGGRGGRSGNVDSAVGGDSASGGGKTYTEDFSDAQSVVDTITHVWGGDAYLEIKEDAYKSLISYYNSGDLAHGGSGSLSYANGTTLRMACGYDDIQTGITVSSTTVTNLGGAYMLADGKEYTTGALKPTWAELSRRLGINFKDEFTGKGSARAEFSFWSEQLSKVDMVSGNAESLQEAGSQGKLVNIANYLDMMPNFKAYLDSNPIVRMSITGSVIGNTRGAIYFSPYFDGVDDIDRMPLMRVDYLETLLNGSEEFTLTTRTNSGKTFEGAYYSPYMPTSGSVTVDVVKKDGSGVERITKDYSKYGNIVEKMNEAAMSGTLTSESSVRMLREYIDKTYDGYYGENRADLFEGQNAAWDADELVALLRCVTLNPKLLNKTSEIHGIFTREENNNQRRVDMLKLTGVLFGVRGLDSRQEYFYFDKDGKMHDARQELDTYAALERMNALVKEGLVSSDYVRQGSTDSEKYLGSDLGFMSYDYNQTQTIYNDVGTLDKEAGEKYMAIMVPVARWFDGNQAEGTYMRFTESWRSVKSDGWAISAAGVGNDTDKLYAALKLIDYAYSDAGIILMSYGPDAFIKVRSGMENAEVGEGGVTIEDKYVCFNFNGKMMPEITNETYDELKDKAKGNYTNYARRYLGSTLSFMKSQAFEYQCTSAVGKEGVSKLSVAIALGTIKHPLLSVNADNMWYTSVPTTFPLTATDNTDLAKYSKLSADGKFSQSKGQTNSFVNLICGGYQNFNKGSV